MGNFNLKINVLRCENCYSIRRITIDPNVPHSFINLECRCNTSRKNLQNFLNELRKGIQLKINCNNCKKEDKNSLYCNNCNHIYCSKCISSHNKHVFIPLSKLDYYCVFHQNDLYCAYCYDCSLNLCKKCIKDKKHLNHNYKEFKKLIMAKNDRTYLKEKLGLAQSKLEFNTQFVNAFIKRVNKEETKTQIINAEKKNLAQNNDILELINFFMLVYDNSKNKNFSIIHNFIENINLNVNKFKFITNNISLENATEQLLNYLHSDFIVVKNDGNWDEDNRNDIKRNKSIWEIDDDCVIESRQTVIGANAFDVIMSYTEFPKVQKSEELKLNTNNNLNKKSVDENKIQNNDSEDGEEKVIINRPRSHAFFVPASVCQKQIKENNHLHEEKNNINNELNTENVKKEENKPEKVNEENEGIKEEEKENIKENQVIKEEKEKEEEENLNAHQENEAKEEDEVKVENEVKEDKETKEENEVKEEEVIKAKQETKIKETYIDKENKNKSFKYAKFVGINRYRNKTNSIVNKMMINSFKNSKII